MAVGAERLQQRSTGFGPVLRHGPGVVGCALLALGLAGCDPQDSPTWSRPAGFIAVVGAGQDDPLWPVLRASALRLENTLGDVPIRVAAPSMVSSHAQARLLRELRSEGMRGLCLQVIDPVAIAPHLERLVNEGVAVTTMIHRVSAVQSLMHCGVDSMLIGETLADTIAEALEERGTIGVIHANSKSDYARRRYDAFIVRIRQHPGITVLREFDCGGNAQRAQDMIRRYMERFPRLDGWVAIDNWPLRGLDAAKPLLPPSARLVTTDPHPGVWEHLATGGCFAMVAADYDEIAQNAVRQCGTAMEGTLVKWRVQLAKPRTVSADNLHAFKLEWLAWCSRRPTRGP
ncbi:MAG: sugar ABC transporter substrate-binding protein [bacterium]|nr:sugar ABC transporter substrate-binding protein [bacterium]